MIEFRTDYFKESWWKEYKVYKTNPDGAVIDIFCFVPVKHKHQYRPLDIKFNGIVPLRCELCGHRKKYLRITWGGAFALKYSLGWFIHKWEFSNNRFISELWWKNKWRKIWRK